MERPKEPTKAESAQTSLPSDIDQETEEVLKDIQRQADEIRANDPSKKAKLN